MRPNQGSMYELIAEAKGYYSPINSGVQYIEHYKCGNAPAIHVDPALPIAELDYLIGLSPPRYPLPVKWDIDPLYRYYICRYIYAWLWAR